MSGLRSYNKEEPSPWGRFFCFSAAGERGNVLLYILLAVALLAALSYVYAKDSRENYASQGSVSIAESLYSQVNMIKSAVAECVAEYPGGGGDMDGNGVIDTSDNQNNPYPLAPTATNNPKASPGGCTTLSGTCTANVCSVSGAICAAADDSVSNLACIGAPAGAAAMFSGTSNQGRFLPPPPNGFTNWVYKNDATGVYIQITSGSDATSTIAMTRLIGMFCSGTATSCSPVASLSGNTITIWIVHP